MLTDAELTHMFTYHPPTEEQKPKYAAIRAAEREALGLLFREDMPTYDEVNATLRRLAEVIDANAPHSADKSAAIRCVRLARNCLNEAIALGTKFDNGEPLEFPENTHLELILPGLQEQAVQNIRAARWQANTAIALEGSV